MSDQNRNPFASLVPTLDEPNSTTTSTSTSGGKKRKTTEGGRNKKKPSENQPNPGPNKPNQNKQPQQSLQVQNVDDSAFWNDTVAGDIVPFEELSKPLQVGVAVKQYSADVEFVFNVLAVLTEAHHKGVNLGPFAQALSRYNYPVVSKENIVEAFAYLGTEDPLAHRQRNYIRTALLVLHSTNFLTAIPAIVQAIVDVKRKTLPDGEEYLTINLADTVNSLTIRPTLAVDLYGLKQPVTPVEVLNKTFPNGHIEEINLPHVILMAAYTCLVPRPFNQKDGQFLSTKPGFIATSTNLVSFNFKSVGDIPTHYGIISAAVRGANSQYSFDQYFRNSLLDVSRNGHLFLYRCFAKIVEEQGVNQFAEYIKTIVGTVMNTCLAVRVRHDPKAKIQNVRDIFAASMKDMKVKHRVQLDYVTGWIARRPEQKAPVWDLMAGFLALVDTVTNQLEAIFTAWDVLNKDGTFNPYLVVEKAFEGEKETTGLPDRLYHCNHFVNALKKMEKAQEIMTATKSYLAPGTDVQKAIMAQTLHELLLTQADSAVINVVTRKITKFYPELLEHENVLLVAEDNDFENRTYNPNSPNSLSAMLSRVRPYLSERLNQGVNTLQINFFFTRSRYDWIRNIAQGFSRLNFSRFQLNVYMRAIEFGQNDASALFSADPEKPFPALLDFHVAHTKFSSDTTSVVHFLRVDRPPHDLKYSDKKWRQVVAHTIGEKAHLPLAQLLLDEMATIMNAYVLLGNGPKKMYIDPKAMMRYLYWTLEGSAARPSDVDAEIVEAQLKVLSDQYALLGEGMSAESVMETGGDDNTSTSTPEPGFNKA